MDQSQAFLTRSETIRLVVYTVVLAVVFTMALICLVAWAAPDTARVGTADSRPVLAGGWDLASMLLAMFAAGGAGGALCNLRGIFRRLTAYGGFAALYEIPFYIRPLTGAMTGIFVFFVGHLVVTSLSNAPGGAAFGLKERLLYSGIAVVAGFASQEFMQRMKEVATTMFAIDSGSKEQPDTARDGTTPGPSASERKGRGEEKTATRQLAG